jgi:hypothetical protein
MSDAVTRAGMTEHEDVLMILSTATPTSPCNKGVGRPIGANYRDSLGVQHPRPLDLRRWMRC